jgi:hypothetical protein
MLLNGAAQIEETATQLSERQKLNFQATEHASFLTIALRRGFLVSAVPQFSLLHSVTCVQLRLITILGNCGCVAVATFLGVPSA